MSMGSIHTTGKELRLPLANQSRGIHQGAEEKSACFDRGTGDISHTARVTLGHARLHMAKAPLRPLRYQTCHSCPEDGHGTCLPNFKTIHVKDKFSPPLKEAEAIYHVTERWQTLCLPQGGDSEYVAQPGLEFRSPDPQPQP